MICAVCSHKNRPGVKFCEQCGSQLSKDNVSLASDKYCSHCGNTLRPGIRFCEVCGVRTISSPPSYSPQSISRKKSGAGIWLGAGIASVVLLVAVAICGGVWWMVSRNGGLNWANTPSTVPVEPELSVMEVQAIFKDPAIRTNPDIDPWMGFTVEDKDGTIYSYDRSTWSVVTPGGDLWGFPGPEANIIEAEWEVQVTQVSAEDIGWVREILDNNPGLTRVDENYRIDDFGIYRDSFIESLAGKKILHSEYDPGVITLSKPQPSSFVWVEPGDDHVWFIDDTAAILMVAAGEAMEVAGRLIPDGISGAVWEPAPNTEILSGSVMQVFSKIEGSVVQEGRTKIPFKVYISGEAPPITMKKIPIDNGREITITLSPPAEKCRGFFKCARQKVTNATASVGSGAASAFKKGMDGTINLTGKALDHVNLENASCLTLVDGGGACVLAYGKTAVDKTVALGEGTVDLAAAVWKVRGNVFREKDCKRTGPNPPGGLAARRFPVNGYSLDGISTPDTTDWPDQLELARRWMPLIEYSKDEQCGEILRVFAKVFAYTPSGGKAASLAEAVRIEIVYTLFFDKDGGRFEVLGKDHPGDNEGFVIGLIRTDQRSGLCATGFEFAGGRSVSHSDAGGALVQYLEINKRQIDDFGPSSVGKTCPNRNPQDRNDPWRILVSEGKHATYYHRDSNQSPSEGIPFPDTDEDPNFTNCEASLGPNLPILIPALIGLGPESAFVFDGLIKLAPDNVKANLANGLEECEAGRDLLDLSPLVELYSEDLVKDYAIVLGFTETYQTENGLKSFAEQARGKWCLFKDENGAEPKRPKCDGYDFHVPNLFNIATAGLGGSEQIAPLVKVPGVANIGLTETQARQNLQAVELQMQVAGIIDGPESLVGTVVKQDPLAGSSVTRGSIVRVWIGVKSAPTPANVPWLSGTTESQARQIASGLGLSIRVAGTLPSDSANVGLVVDQSPASGTLAYGGIIDIWLGSISSVAVPDLGGLPEYDAINLIQANGFIAQKAGTIPITDSGFNGRIIDQDPGYGQSALPGSVIHYWVGVLVEFPAQRTSPWVTLSINGGHGSFHKIGNSMDLCYSWGRIPGEPSGKWQVWLFQPPESDGVMLNEGSMDSTGSTCPFKFGITGPTGYGEIVIFALEYDYSTMSWKTKDWANVWIYVTE